MKFVRFQKVLITAPSRGWSNKRSKVLRYSPKTLILKLSKSEQIVLHHDSYRCRWYDTSGFPFTVEPLPTAMQFILDLELES